MSKKKDDDQQQDQGSGQQTSADNGNAQDTQQVNQASAPAGGQQTDVEAYLAGTTPFKGAPVLFTHPDGREEHAAFIGRVREHGGCDLFVLAPGGCYWESNIRQGEGANTWRYNPGPA